MKTFLASTSPARLMLLRAAGIEPEIVAPLTDEEAIVASATAEKGEPLSAQETVTLLATEKARSIIASLADETGVVIGSDSMFELEGELLGKPHTAERARERWMNQIGKTGTLHSGICLIHLVAGKVVGEVTTWSEAEVTFAGDITESELEAYIATGEPLRVAGAFTIDSIGSAFVKSIVGDPSTVVGMSIPRLREMVRELGIEWPSLWNLAGK